MVDLTLLAALHKNAREGANLRWKHKIGRREGANERTTRTLLKVSYIDERSRTTTRLKYGEEKYNLQGHILYEIAQGSEIPGLSFALHSRAFFGIDRMACLTPKSARTSSAAHVSHECGWVYMPWTHRLQEARRM